MLTAILKGKAGRILLNGEEQSWKDVFRQREDLLTAVFFSRITYLSPTGQARVLALLIGDEEAASLGTLREVIFWPKLRGLDSRCFVEPDILMLFNTACVLIEAKPPTRGLQSVDQWHNEITSLVIQKSIDSTEWSIPESIYFVALGRNFETWRTAANLLETEFAEHGLVVKAAEWETINHGIAKLTDCTDERDNAVYRDWLEAFGLFGLIEPPLPFRDLITLLNTDLSGWRNIFSSCSPASEGTVSQKPIDWLSMSKALEATELRMEEWK